MVLHNIKRQKIILNQIEKFKKEGFENIVLSGFSAGAWASLNLQSKFSNKIKGTIAINPAAFGKKSMTAGADRRNAITEFKNKIVEKEGNAGVISNQLNSKAGFEISGYALDCENLE